MRFVRPCVVLFVVLYGRASSAACDGVSFAVQRRQLPAGVRLRYVLPLYYLHTAGGCIDARAAAVLRSALDLDQSHPPPAVLPRTPGQARVNLYCVPRLGTVSPWSSKASDILHVCGVSNIIRIERGDCYALDSAGALPLSQHALRKIAACLHDPLIHTASFRCTSARAIFSRSTETGDDFAAHGSFDGDSIDDLLRRTSDSLGLGLGDAEYRALASFYRESGRAPTSAELVMYAQVNSEHCRHKIFNTGWIDDDGRQAQSMFALVKDTYRHHPASMVSAYDDNAAVVSHSLAWCHDVHAFGKKIRWRQHAQPQDYLIKVETHNHPTAISPYQGAATGCGGEIRDEAAAGCGGEPAIGISGFAVSNLCIPYHTRSWEKGSLLHPNLASPLDIMLQGPIGCAAYNNEFGRPALAGFFRTLEYRRGDKITGFHKPIMLAGGAGYIRARNAIKKRIVCGTPIVVLGGPGYLIGLGGGTASSTSGVRDQKLDFASVQRANPEMQRRAQEVIWRSSSLIDEDNPILSIHDVGAGGLANAVSELLHQSQQGGCIDLRAVPCADSSMNSMEIWCNESQERYVAAVREERLDSFLAVCRRERCPVAVIGRSTDSPVLRLYDSRHGRDAVCMPMRVLFPESRGCRRRLSRPCGDNSPCDERLGRGRVPAAASDARLDVKSACEEVLAVPAVASKSFLITIGDRSVGGLVARDQMVGPWQVPAADVAVCCADFILHHGTAAALGECPAVAMLDAPASGRLAVSEAVLNIMAADIESLGDIKLSANWMADSSDDEQLSRLYATVQAVAQLCKSLCLTIPVGKDSLFMRKCWQRRGRLLQSAAPLSLVVTAFAKVHDVRATLTPVLRSDTRGSALCFIDLSDSPDKECLGGSAAAHIGRCGHGRAPDFAQPVLLTEFHALLRVLRRRGQVLAYHDRSAGGLFACLAEMAFAAACGLDADLRALGGSTAQVLFSEGPGVVLQLDRQGLRHLQDLTQNSCLHGRVHYIGAAQKQQRISLRTEYGVYSWETMYLKRLWHDTSFQMQKMRDNPHCAAQEADFVCDGADPGLSAHLKLSGGSRAVQSVVRRTPPPSGGIKRAGY